MTDKLKRVKSLRIVDHGPEHAQYFQGHGIALTRYTDSATGCGSTPGEALEDALDMLAQNGWELSTAHGPDGRFGPGPATCADAVDLQVSEGNAHSDCPEDDEACELYWYVSVDVEG